MSKPRRSRRATSAWGPSGGGGCPPKRERPICRRPEDAAGGLAGLVEDYRRRVRRRAEEEERFYAGAADLDEAIRIAGRCLDARGKRHGHQRRLSAATLGAWLRKLERRRGEMARAQAFDELFRIVTACKVDGVGELTIYDTACRIGAYLGLAPEHVYLHAGTREGARALGLDVSAGVLKRADLPRELRRMRASDVENFLCIYKGAIEGFRKG